MSSVIYKSCKCCGVEKQLTSDNWHSEKTSKDGFRHTCKICRNNYRSNVYFTKEKLLVEFVLRNQAKSRERYAKYGEAIREKQKEYHARPEIKGKRHDLNKYRLKTDQCFRETNRLRSKAWYEANKIRSLNNSKDWRSRNFDKYKANEKLYSFLNRDRNRERNRKWNSENTERVSMYSRPRNASRRAKILNAKGSHTWRDILHILKQQNGICYYCKCDISGGKHTVDHYIPLSKGGANSPDNLVMACSKCNSSKRAKMPEEFINYLLQFAS
ncbi:MAG: HNH endonuclease [Negativicutes bacterium]|jgi:5-methylcytosine-specific restriction endonuclease McrA